MSLGLDLCESYRWVLEAYRIGTTALMGYMSVRVVRIANSDWSHFCFSAIVSGYRGKVVEIVRLTKVVQYHGGTWLKSAEVKAQGTFI
jgi:hypothetical protein